jgi:hypothetical protein
MLGVNHDGVYLSANQWDLSTETLVGAQVFSIPKSDLLAATPTAANASVFTSTEPAIGQYPHPVAAYGTSGSEAIISQISNSTVQISSVDSPASGASLNVSDRQFTIPAASDAFSASQKGTSVQLDLRDNSQFGATPVMADGVLFAIRAIQLANGSDGITWYVIGDPLGAPALLSTGTIAPPDLNVYEPSIAVNDAGDAVIGFSGSGPNDYPSAFAVAGKLNGNALSFGDPILLKAGAGPYLGTDAEQGDGATLVRWGDYSATTVDPDDPMNFWTTQAWAKADATLGTLWSTQITEIIAAPCFAAGTRIGTDRGEIAVETLRIRDTVKALVGNAPAEVIWIGCRTVNCAQHRQPCGVWPVRIAADAFGAGRPCRALLLSPDHAVFMWDVLVPVKHLINGASIVQVPMDTVTYYHLELARHDVVVAEGLPVESYLDTGNRANFANGAVPVAPHPDFWHRTRDLDWLTYSLRVG